MASQKIIVASSKGGVGKSTVALGVSGALSALGKTVLLCDLDFENRSLDLFMGLENVSLFNIADVANGIVSSKKAIIKNSSGLSFIGAPDSDVIAEDGSLTIPHEKIAKAVKEVVDASKADFVVFDTGTAHEIPVLLAETFPDAMALIVASHQAVSTRGAEKTAAILARHGIKNSRLVICGYEFKEAAKKERSGIIDIIDSSKVQLIGAVPYDRSLLLSHERGIRPPKDSPSSIAFENIAERICKNNVRLFDGIETLKRSKIV